MKPPLPIIIYRLLSRLCFAPLLWIRQKQGKEDKTRLHERHAKNLPKRPKGQLIWIHAASVGETASILGLCDYLLEKKKKILLTTGTQSSARMVAQRNIKGILHQYAPMDSPKVVKRFLTHWHPALACFVESELWLNMIMASHEKGIKLLLINGRMSAKSFRKWQRFPKSIKALLTCFDSLLAQDVISAERLQSLGAKKIEVSGNLKLDSPPLPRFEAEEKQLLAQINTRKTWLAASTHAGEEEACSNAHKKLKTQYKDLLTIIVPRHPERGEAIQAKLKASGFSVALYSKNQKIEKTTDIYIGDTIGRMGLFYRLSDIVFMGGSLIPHGGQNPLEPARLGASLLSGRNIHNFSLVYTLLEKAGAVLFIEKEESLSAQIASLLENEKKRQRLAQNGRKFLNKNFQAREKTLAAIKTQLGESP